MMMTNSLLYNLLTTTHRRVRRRYLRMLCGKSISTNMENMTDGDVLDDGQDPVKPRQICHPQRTTFATVWPKYIRASRAVRRPVDVDTFRCRALSRANRAPVNNAPRQRICTIKHMVSLARLEYRTAALNELYCDAARQTMKCSTLLATLCTIVSSPHLTQLHILCR